MIRWFNGIVGWYVIICLIGMLISMIVIDLGKWWLRMVNWFRFVSIIFLRVKGVGGF